MDVTELRIKNKVRDKEFNAKLAKASELIPTKDLVPGVKFQESDTDLGFGGFYSAGHVDFWGWRNLSKNWKSDIDFYWPKDLASGKLMKYLGSFNLGRWPKVFSDATKQKAKEKYDIPFDPVIPYDSLDDFDSIGLYTVEYTLHVLIGSVIEHHPVYPDCAVFLSKRKTLKPEFDASLGGSIKKDIENEISDFTKEKIREVNESDMVCKLPFDLKTPKVWAGKPELFFTFDGEKRPKLKEDWGKIMDDENLNELYHGAGFSCYGSPSTQQEPMRPISPNTYNKTRYLTPVFNFTDEENDMTYQFYSDIFLAKPGQAHFAKVDASCT